MRLLLLAALVIAAPGLAGAATPAPEPVAELVLVAANTGNAAGGHVALRLGERAYHYQVGPDGLLRLARDTWQAFQLQYRVLENRSLEVHRLGIAPENHRRLEERLSRLHAVESVQIARLEVLALERRWVEGLGHEAATVPLPGVGLFSRARSEQPAARRLRGAVEARHGRGFLRAELAAVEADVRDGALRVSAAGEYAPEPGVLSELHEIEAERRYGALVLREALRAVEAGWPLEPGALVDADARAARTLQSEEREALLRQREELEAAVLRLLGSRRTDRGEALLLAIARHQAVQRSLALDRLVVLDPTPSDAPSLDPRVLGDRREDLAALAEGARRAYLDARTLALAGGFDERSQRQLETLAALTSGFAAALEGDGPVRLWAGGSSSPLRSGPVPLPRVDVPPGWRETALATARAHEARARVPFEYELFARNCATELAGAIVSAFADADEAAAALGGRLDPDAARHFYPAAFVHTARRTWAVRESRELPSWRKQLVAGFAEREHPLLVGLRESNAWTSRAYRGSFQDEPFVFFTDGLVWLRPLQGVVNVGYGLGHAVLGALSLPVDGGHRARAGLRGAFFSVPELVGVNIRKGSYDLPPAMLVEQARESRFSVARSAATARRK